MTKPGATWAFLSTGKLMSKKCCNSKPRCKNCPKRKKAQSGESENYPIAPVDRSNRTILYFAPLTDISINGQRGCTEKLPAGLARLPDCKRRQPASAIIAPLSVQNSSSG